MSSPKHEAEYSAWFWRRRKHFHKRETWVAELLRREFHPDSVYDAGCGAGSFMGAFLESGCRVAGCDANLDKARPWLVKEAEPFMEQRDLSRFNPWPDHFGLVLCIEVGEHLPEGTHAYLFNNLRELLAPGGDIFFTGGQPQQRGYGHLSPRTLSQWIAEARGQGLVYDHDRTRKVIDRFYNHNEALGLARNALVFRGEP